MLPIAGSAYSAQIRVPPTTALVITRTDVDFHLGHSFLLGSACWETWRILQSNNGSCVTLMPLGVVSLPLDYEDVDFDAVLDLAAPNIQPRGGLSDKVIGMPLI